MTRFTTDLGRVADDLPDSLLIVEADGMISWTNDATVRLLGLEIRGWVGRSLRELVHTDDLAAVDRAHRDGTGVEAHLLDGSGGWRRLEIRGRAMPGGGNGTAFTMLMVRDAARPAEIDLDASPES